MPRTDLLRTALVLARQGDTDDLIRILEQAKRWRDPADEDSPVTAQAIYDALGGRPLLKGWPDRTDTITLDASGGQNVSRLLPSAITDNTDLIYARRVDDDQSGSAKLVDPDAHPIYREQETANTELSLRTERRAVLYRNPPPDGAGFARAWHVWPDVAVYETVSTVTGVPRQSQLFLQHPVRHSYWVESMRVRAQNGASNNYDLTVTIDGSVVNAPAPSYTLPGGAQGGAQDVTFSVDTLLEDYVVVEGQSTQDPTLANVSVAFGTDR